MYAPSEHNTSNTYIRALQSPTKRSSVTSPLRARDKENKFLDKLAGLCAGSGAQSRIERMQETRIMKVLASSPTEESDAATAAVTDELTFKIQKLKEPEVIDEEREAIRKEVDKLLDEYADDMLQVSSTTLPAMAWADEVGGSIIGVRETINLRTPWMVPNFGITFRYRHKEEEVKKSKASSLPGAGNLYGGHWNSLEPEPTFSPIYDPTPYDPAPVGHFASSTALSGPQAPEMKYKLPKSPLSHANLQAESRNRLRANSGATRFSEDHFSQGPNLCAHFTTAKTHTIPAPNDYVNHISCFPTSALPHPHQHQFHITGPCSRCPSIEQVGEELQEYRLPRVASHIFSRVASAVSITEKEVDPKSARITAWQQKVFKDQRRDLRERENDHRMAASPRAEIRGYNATRMLEDDKRRIEEQKMRLKMQKEEDHTRGKKDEEHHFGQVVDEHHPFSEAGIALSQANLERAFNRDSSKSGIVAHASYLVAVIPYMEGAVEAHARAQVLRAEARDLAAEIREKAAGLMRKETRKAPIALTNVSEEERHKVINAEELVFRKESVQAPISRVSSGISIGIEGSAHSAGNTGDGATVKAKAFVSALQTIIQTKDNTHTTTQSAEETTANLSTASTLRPATQPHSMAQTLVPSMDKTTTSPKPNPAHVSTTTAKVTGRSRATSNPIQIPVPMVLGHTSTVDDSEDEDDDSDGSEVSWDHKSIRAMANKPNVYGPENTRLF